ncbi:PDDEXK nuclease domain-containing protein [Bryobacter aggregatus]|uniref:PDDEXK nuclease domain-containing protein n=1 Tax=Bryobacter aggregatus TaxID=360054 RepID=UPI00055F6BD5|nr:PDDEXK nuclease domain-containing protein [Bryobacter aggregatus]
MDEQLSQPAGYRKLLEDIKARIQTAQVRAGLAVNRELVLLYWSIGREILTRQDREGWGAKVIESLARDLHFSFPEMKGLSPRNLKYMRAFAEAWPEQPIVQAPLAQITWYHNLALLEKIQTREERIWYAQQTVVHGWSRNVLVLQIESGLYGRQGRAISNFKAALPKPQSDLAQQILKDPYNFDFLTLDKDARERDIERGLLEHLRQFLLELGSGFAFVGSQVPLSIGREDYRIDLLFYHLKLRAFIVAEVKSGPFRPHYAGQLNFYLSAVDDLFRHPSDQPSIGLILCRSKEGVVVEYALRDIGKPMGIAEFRLTESLPENLKSSLPSIEELESELDQRREDDATSHEPSSGT